MTRRLARRAFALLWASETTFDLGSALMTFALGVWVFQRTGSAQQFSGAILAAAFPSLLVTPFAGAFADRFDRRWVIAGCDAASVVLITVLAVLLFGNRLEPHHLYMFNAGSAIVGTIRIPTYRAALGSIVPREQLTRAGGLLGVTQSILQIMTPLLAGYLMGVAGLTGVVVVQIFLVVAGAITAFGALSRSRRAVRGVERVGRTSILAETVRSFRSALAYLRKVPTMAGLAIYGAIQECLVALAGSMMIPLVLSTHTSEAVGLILSCGAVGGLVGSVLLVIAPVRRRQMLWVLVAHFFVSLILILVGFMSSTALWSACAFGAYFGGAVSTACATALLLRKTPIENRGSIFALNAALNGLMLCVAMLVGGYLAEHVFEPALVEGGAWATTVGAWVGTGKGRGLAFIFILCGAGGGALSLVALVSNWFRNFDEHTLDPPEEPKVGVGQALAVGPLGIPGRAPGAAEGPPLRSHIAGPRRKGIAGDYST